MKYLKWVLLCYYSKIIDKIIVVHKDYRKKGIATNSKLVEYDCYNILDKDELIFIKLQNLKNMEIKWRSIIFMNDNINI